MVVLIIGFGSIGLRHYTILNKIKKIKKIYIISNQRLKKKFNPVGIHELKNINPDYIIIAKPTSEHFYYAKIIDQNLKNKKVLIEKPVFNKKINYKFKNNYYFVGYNLRFNPLINYVKKVIKNNKIISAKFFCVSDLTKWRKNIHYTKSSSAKKVFGGGVLNDLSHEIDFLQWFFGDLKFNFFKKEKLSKLKINTDDNFEAIGHGKRIKRFSISLNYFSKLNKRFFTINGNRFTIYADLIKSELQISKNYKYRKIIFRKFNYNDSYKKMHLSILNKNFLNNKLLCSLQYGKKIQDYLTKML
jgi:CMP-N,N'-diacetyllegionaminic acid synthase